MSESVGSSESRQPARGLVIVFTGEGKGKTTAAIGMGVRAAGHKLAVLCVQFIKGHWKTGEGEALAALSPYFELVRMGKGFTVEGLRSKRVSRAEHVEAAASALPLARSALSSGKYRMVILDEILGAIKDGLIPLADVLDLIASKPADVHLVLTGRGAGPEIVEAADLVTEMRLIKHPYQQGIPAQRGVEF